MYFYTSFIRHLISGPLNHISQMDFILFSLNLLLFLFIHFFIVNLDSILIQK